MTQYVHPNGDTIQVLKKGKFVVTRSGVEQHFDVSHWGKNPEGHIDGDIRAGYYAGFKKVVEDQDEEDDSDIYTVPVRDVFQLDQDRMMSRMADAEMGDL